MNHLFRLALGSIFCLYTVSPVIASSSNPPGSMGALVSSEPTVYDNTFTSDHVNKPIRLKKENAKFKIQLPDDGTDGYVWLLENYNKDALILESYKPDPNANDGRGSFIWHFTVKPEAFNAPHKLQIDFLFGDPDSIDKYEKFSFIILTSIDS
ncbi:MAG: protease inhibitor I42 family protein [Gammaproteobacteria bacterium]